VFATYACIGLLLVVALGVAMATGYGSLAKQRGLAEGRSEAALLAQTVVEPALNGRPLSAGLTTTERAALTRSVTQAVASHGVLRLRLRDLAGNVVFADDGSGQEERPEVTALQAADGATVARLSHLNSDANDSGPPGPESVEVYLPLRAGSPRHLVGVLEIYLPYAPISADVAGDLHNLYRDLAIGLALLYLVLFGLAFWVSRDLRRQVASNVHLAEHDTLTDLPNRGVYRRRAQQALQRSSLQRPVVLAIVDLDRFKDVNDTLGHRTGDALLCEIARRIDAACGPGDTVARLGGDEFGLVLTSGLDPDSAFRHLRELIDLETSIDGLPLSIEASIGYVVAPHDGTGVDDLMQRAEIAMYTAKSRRSGVAHYEPSQDTYDPSSLTLVSELRHGITADELVLLYQPKTRLSDGRAVAVEALVRWQHPVLGLLAPGRFLPLAEQTDLIYDLTGWVVDAALSDLARLPDDISVAVNISARNLVKPEFSSMVIEALEARSVAPGRLILEVTETALLADPLGASQILQNLNGHGVRVSIDDFGSGQTSLGYLSSLPVHELKIDKSFVSDMLQDEGHAAIVRSIVDLGHNLSVRVVAEGIESLDVLTSLRHAGCDEAQGFFIARPMPLGPLVEWLSRRRVAGDLTLIA
jgi:diguanylate cyclase (GGDEF)-like protein